MPTARPAGERRLLDDTRAKEQAPRGFGAIRTASLIPLKVSCVEHGAQPVHRGSAHQAIAMGPGHIPRLGCLLAFIACFVGNEACAQGYPAKPIRVVDAYPPGGSTDVVARMIGQKFLESQKQPWVVDNRAVVVVGSFSGVS
jgi:hypothetical protein